MVRQLCCRPTVFCFGSKHEHQRPALRLTKTTVLDKVSSRGEKEGWTVTARWGRSTVLVHVTVNVLIQWINYLIFTFSYCGSISGLANKKLMLLKFLSDCIRSHCNGLMRQFKSYTCWLHMSAQQQAKRNNCLVCFWSGESSWPL